MFGCMCSPRVPAAAPAAGGAGLEDQASQRVLDSLEADDAEDAEGRAQPPPPPPPPPPLPPPPPPPPPSPPPPKKKRIEIDMDDL